MKHNKRLLPSDHDAAAGSTPAKKARVSVQQQTTCMLLNSAEARVQYWPRAVSLTAKEVAVLVHGEIPWEQEQIVRFGQTMEAKRKTVTMGDSTHLTYRYAGQTKRAHVWSPLTLRLKQHVEQLTGHRFNFVVWNLYENGDDYIGPHGDDTRDLAENSVIASISFGAARDFVLKHNATGSRIVQNLGPGDVLTMDMACQHYYKHSVPVRKRVHEPRLNATFRLLK